MGVVTEKHVIFIIGPHWLSNERVLPIHFLCRFPWILCTRVRNWVSIVYNLSTRGFLHWSPTYTSHQMKASYTRGVIITSGRNISRRLFWIDCIFLCLVVIWVVPYATWILPSTFISKGIIIIINYFSLRVSIFRSLVPPGSRRFISVSFLFYGACTFLLCQRGVFL